MNLTALQNPSQLVPSPYPFYCHTKTTAMSMATLWVEYGNSMAKACFRVQGSKLHIVSNLLTLPSKPQSLRKHREHRIIRHYLPALALHHLRVVDSMKPLDEYVEECPSFNYIDRVSDDDSESFIRYLFIFPKRFKAKLPNPHNPPKPMIPFITLSSQPAIPSILSRK